MLERYYLPLLVKLGVVAAIASVLARSNQFKRSLMRDNRTLNQRVGTGAVAAQWCSARPWRRE